MTSTNDNIDLSVRHDNNLVQKVDINKDEQLKIILNNITGEVSKMEKVEVIEKSELKDCVEICRNMFYEQVDKTYEISVDGNDITIIDNFESISIYQELPFISYTMQEKLMVGFPKTVYKIYIPQGMEHSILR
jgi:hypothetical protein